MDRAFITKGFISYLHETEKYSEVQERKIQILQAANGYLAINMLYQSVQILWSFINWYGRCPVFAYLSLGLLIIDVFWAITSIYGFRSINSRNSNNITIFGHTVIANILLRVGLYFISGLVMSKYIISFSIDPAQTPMAVCNAIYPRDLFILEGVIQGLACVIILYLYGGAAEYVKNWEKEEAEASREQAQRTKNSIKLQQ